MLAAIDCLACNHGLHVSTTTGQRHHLHIASAFNKNVRNEDPLPVLPLTLPHCITLVGGRCNTRQTYWQDLAFDHGAQFFPARSDKFKEVVQDWVGRGLVAEWRGQFVAYDAASGRCSERTELSDNNLDAGRSRSPGFFNFVSGGPIYVGTPGMNSICRYAAKQRSHVR